MKHRIVGRRLDRTTEHRTAMFKNMATSLFLHEKIVTTTPKAKEMKRFAEKLITLAKKGTAHARRQANAEIRDVEVLNKLFGTLGPRFANRGPSSPKSLFSTSTSRTSWWARRRACGVPRFARVITLSAMRFSSFAFGVVVSIFS